MTGPQRRVLKSLVDRARREEIDRLEQSFRNPITPSGREPEKEATMPRTKPKTDAAAAGGKTSSKRIRNEAASVSAADAQQAETEAAVLRGEHLTEALLARVKETVPSAKRVDAKSGAYFRLMDGKLTIGYVNPSKKGLILDLATPRDKVPAGVEVKHGPTAKLPVKFKVASDEDVEPAVKMIEAAALAVQPQK